MVESISGGWRQVGDGWVRDEGVYTLTAWHRVDGWVWRCRTVYVSADPRYRMRDGKAGSAEEARGAADAAHAALLAEAAAKTPKRRGER